MTITSSHHDTLVTIPDHLLHAAIITHQPITQIIDDASPFNVILTPLTVIGLILNNVVGHRSDQTTIDLDVETTTTTTNNGETNQIITTDDLVTDPATSEVKTGTAKLT